MSIAQLRTVAPLLAVALFLPPTQLVQAFVVAPPRSLLTASQCATGRGHGGRASSRHIAVNSTMLFASPAVNNDDDDDERELARVRRGGRRERSEDDDDVNRRGSGYYDERGDESYTAEEDVDESWDYVDDDDDEEEEDWDDDDEGEEYELFGNVLIPNPLLDSMDPDGAAERFPELARDPRFWFDMVLFISFLDFLSFAGPRDPFPDLPMY